MRETFYVAVAYKDSGGGMNLKARICGKVKRLDGVFKQLMLDGPVDIHDYIVTEDPVEFRKFKVFYYLGELDHIRDCIHMNEVKPVRREEFREEVLRELHQEETATLKKLGREGNHLIELGQNVTNEIVLQAIDIYNASLTVDPDVTYMAN